MDQIRRKKQQHTNNYDQITRANTVHTAHTHTLCFFFCCLNQNRIDSFYLRFSCTTLNFFPVLFCFVLLLFFLLVFYFGADYSFSLVSRILFTSLMLFLTLQQFTLSVDRNPFFFWNFIFEFFFLFSFLCCLNAQIKWIECATRINDKKNKSRIPRTKPLDSFSFFCSVFCDYCYWLILFFVHSSLSARACADRSQSINSYLYIYIFLLRESWEWDRNRREEKET